MGINLYFRRESVVFLLFVFYSIFTTPSLGISVNRPKLSDRELLHRCYTQLSGARLSSSSLLWKELDHRSPSTICLELLKKAILSSNGSLVNSNDLLSRQILKQMLAFHRTWFDQQWSYLNTFPESFWGGVDVYDAQEPALYLTQSLVTDSAYSKLLSGSMTAVALRDGTQLRASLPQAAGGFLRISRNMYNATEGPVLNSNSISYTQADDVIGAHPSTLATPIVQTGDVYGIQMRSYQNSPLLPIIWTGVYTSTPLPSTEGISVPQPFLANRGGGPLGSVPYILLNLGHGFDYKADGALKLPRRYILSVFQNFLCRKGPFLRSSDVASFKVTSTNPNVPPFRKSEACLGCHATLDPSALILRNLRIAGSAHFVTVTDYRLPPILATYNADLPVGTSEFWPSTPQANFFRTSPKGRLFFRSMTGRLIDIENIQNLEGLGAALMNTPDYYACAASRYFEYFTKYKVELFDPYDSSNAIILNSFSDKDREIREFVLSLGAELGTTSGSLKLLVQRILDSDYYKMGNL